MYPTRRSAALLLMLVACAQTAAAQRGIELVTIPRARHVALPRAAALAAAPSAQCPAYSELPQDTSAGGVLHTELVMAPDTFRIGDSTYVRNVYNGGYNAPVLRMKRGEQLNIDVRNRMVANPAQPAIKIDTTNQHYHGMIVTPLPDTGDNVVPVVIPNPGANRNSFFVPDYQSEGMMWYHPHPHGRTSAQVAGGLAGALMIGDILRSYPLFRGATERVMYIKDTRNGGSAYLNINGTPCMGLTIAPGERQLWRIGNMTGATWLNLKLGERGRGYHFIVLALDGNHLVRPTPMDSLFLAPGQRAEAIVVGGSGPYGTVAFYTDSIASSFDRVTGKLKTVNPRVDLGTLTVQGAPVAGVTAQSVDPRLQPPDQVLADSIHKLVADGNVDTFTVHYQLIGGKLLLNDSSYNPTRLDHAVQVGRTQEWTLINDTWFLHTFHIHQTDFVVTRINGVEQPDSVHLDNVHLGIHPIGGGKWAGDTVVIRFTFNPIAAGPFVYHCHDLQHEDGGMMANVCVFDPRTGRSSCDQWFPGPSGGHSHAGAELIEPAPTAAPAPHAHSSSAHRRE